MARLKALALLALAAVAAFELHGCLRGSVYRDPLPHDGLSAPAPLRVGISEALGVKELTLEGEAVLEPSGRRLSGSIPVRLEGDALTVAGQPVEPPARLTPAEGLLLFGGRDYRGAFEVVRRNGGLDLVNVVSVEDYLAGVVGKEMNLSDPQAALKAQVIAARSYVLHEAQYGWVRRKGLPFDVFDDQRSQVYGGTERETAAARKLVAETAGIVLRWNGQPLKAFYAATCGGACDPADRVLNHPERIPPLQGAPCGTCADGAYFRWSMPPMPIEEASRRLGRGKILSVAAGRRLASGRVETVELSTDRGCFTLEANDEFRRKLDPARIRSTLWDELAVEGGTLVIRGRGWGHGAGMCQSGAVGMAREGFSADQILAHYYPGAAVEKVY
jgi:stage II sporulation protein D